jgi:uncharacterized protein
MDVDVYVSIVVAKQRPRSLIELIDFLLDLDVPFSLNYARDNPNYSTLDDFRPTNATLVDTLSQVIDHLCKSPPKHSLLGSFVDRVNMSFPHRHTCALGQNYMVIGPLGRVFLCQQEMRHPVTSIYETDILTKLANSKLVENPTVDTKENCADCQWRYWCAGGCPVLSTYINGTSKVSSPFCEVYRAIIPKAVRLEGLRLLKHGQTLLS